MLGRIIARQIAEYKQRAEDAEAELVQAQAAVLALTTAPVLAQITKHGRTNVFTFMRKGQVITVETYATMNDDHARWQRELFDNG